jgi:hypothetical protein
MSESGDKLNAAYRALPREEPRAAIDDAILAASRRALAKPSASRRWAAPVSIAAVLVLAFGVTLHMREEKPGIESTEAYSAPVATPAPAAVPEAPAAKSAERVPEPAPKPGKKALVKTKPDEAAPRAFEMRERGLRDEVAPAPKFAPAPALVPERKDLAQQQAPAESLLRKEADQNRAAATTARAAAPPASIAAAAAPQPQALGRMKREAPAAQAPAGFASADAQAPADEPTRELEAIAKLRAEGRHEEADKALAEFRRKRPDYRIAEAMWERVKPR